MRSLLDFDPDVRVVLPDGQTRGLTDYLLPSALLMGATLLLMISLFVPYWSMTLHAPQYPKGLKVSVYLNHLDGDVREVDELNHYLGMPPLDEGGQLERSLSIASVVVLGLLLIAGVFVHNRWAAVLALPALLFPLLFLIDLWWILYRFGHSIDPTSALGRAVQPFTPPLIGPGKVGQFGTVARFEIGLWLALAAVLVVIGALWFHRAAYKPLLEARQRVRVALAMLLLVGIATTTGQARTIVVGNQPGASTDLAAALATAETGDTVRVIGGTYAGPIVVNHSITLEGIDHPILDGHGIGTVVTLNAPGSVLRGFIVQNSGEDADRDHGGITVAAARCLVADNLLREVLFGVFLARADGSIVRDNDISGKRALDQGQRGDGIRLWYSPDVLVERNRLHGVRDAVVWYSKNCVLRGNQISNGRYGVHLMYTDHLLIEQNQLRGNEVGIYVMYSTDVLIRSNDLRGQRGPSGYALGFKDADRVEVEENLLVDNRGGIYSDGTPFSPQGFAHFTRNILAFNDQGMILSPSTRNLDCRFNTFWENTEQVVFAGGGGPSAGSWGGNYWSDDPGYDLDGDGTHDQPYRAERLFEGLMVREPALRMLLHSPAAQAIELAASAFPVMRPQPKLTDPAPADRPLALPATALTADQSAWPLALTGLALLGITAGLTWPSAATRFQ